MRQDFPILEGEGLVYLDNAATTQKPRIVIDTIKQYYETHNANAHRGVYRLSENATRMLEDARKVFARFINTESQNIIFTKSTTESLNSIATSLERTFMFNKDDNIVTTEMEHHSNFLPWQQLASRTGAKFRVVPYDKGTGSIGLIGSHVDENTKIVTFTAMSNVTGLIIDVAEQVKGIRKANRDVIIIIDATQYVAHKPVNVNAWGADFVMFSAHKVYGTTGVGILYGKSKFLESIEPAIYGGNMIKSVAIEESSWAEPPDRFEAGTLDTAGIIASAEAIRYFQKNFTEYEQMEEKLKDYALKRLRTIKGLEIIGHGSSKEKYGPVISFVIKGVHPHDLATICDRHNVCIRSGHHCAQPLMKRLGVPATSRVSISFYNNTSDIDRLVDAINDAKNILKVQ